MSDVVNNSGPPMASMTMLARASNSRVIKVKVGFSNEAPG
jgi:hypothetical protein